MRTFKRRVALTIGTAVVFAGSMLTSSPALAASSPTAACNSIPGNDFHVIDTHDLNDAATIYLLYNGTINCAVTWKKSPYAGSSSTQVDVFIQSWADGSTAQDIGTYLYYAGPVWKVAPDTCIKWGGRIVGSRPTGGSIDYSWTSDWSHCG